MEAGSSTVTEGVTAFAGGLLLDSDTGASAIKHSECRRGGSAGGISGSDTFTLEVRGEGRSVAARALGTGGSAWLSADDDESVLSSSSSAKREMKSVGLTLGHSEIKMLSWPNVRTPEMSHSFSSCIASAVLVMSMDDTERSSLSSTSAGSRVIIADSSEKPKRWRINEMKRAQTGSTEKKGSGLTRIHNSLSGRKKKSFLKGDLLQI